MDLVLTTRYLPLGFHTSMEMGFAMAAPPAAEREGKEEPRGGFSFQTISLPYLIQDLRKRGEMVLLGG